jgi:hypothetical protein
VKNEDSSIDNADMILLPREDAVHGWLLSTSTTIFSKMDLSKPLLPPPSSHPNGPLNSRTPTRLAPCRSLFNQPQYRLSTFSDSSDQGMIEDPLYWSGSDATIEDHQLSESEMWDSYFWSEDKENLPSNFHQVEPTARSPFRHEDSQLSPHNRNFAFSNLSGLNANDFPTKIHRSDAVHTPHRTPKLLPHSTYSPFPAISPPPTHSYESGHKSWPLRKDSQSQPQGSTLRSRAHTSPAKCNHLSASNISTCSTLDDRNSPSHSSSSSTSGLYMRSASVSHQFTPPLMDLMEKSYFDDDSDDDESKIALLATRLHIKRTNSNSPSPCGNKEKQLRSQKSWRNVRGAGDALRGMFGIRK